MRPLILERDPAADGFFLPNIFIDDYMGELHGDAVRVYLYLMRYLSVPSAELSLSSIADALHLTEHDILRAFRSLAQQSLIAITWVNEHEVSSLRILTCKPRSSVCKFVTKELEKLSGQAMTNLPAQETTAEAPLTSTSNPASQPNKALSFPAPAPWTAPERHIYTPEERLAIADNKDLQDLFYAISKYLGRMLTPTDSEAILYYHDGLGFSLELIEYLFEYCISKGHKKIAYIDTVAIGWAKEQITTVEAAKKSSLKYSEGYFKLMKAFGIKDRSLGKAELDLYSKWTDTYGFSTEIILEACNRTLLTTHKPSFDYAEKILQRWNEQGVKSLRDIKRLDAAYDKERAAATAQAPSQGQTPRQPQKSPTYRGQGMQRDYTPSDLDALEKRLLETSFSGST